MTKKASPKQLVLNQYPTAKCFELLPESRLYRVVLDGTKPSYTTPEEVYAAGNYSATAGEAWQRVAKALGEQNARDTNSPFML